MANIIKVLKLITGEEIIARVKYERDLLTLEKPMTFQAVPTNQQGQMGFALVPWIMSAKGEQVTISLTHVLAQDDPQNEAEKNYLSQISGLVL